MTPRAQLALERTRRRVWHMHTHADVSGGTIAMSLRTRRQRRLLSLLPSAAIAVVVAGEHRRSWTGVVVLFFSSCIAP